MAKDKNTATPPNKQSADEGTKGNNSEGGNHPALAIVGRDLTRALTVEQINANRGTGALRAAGSAAASPLKRAASKASESVKSSFSDGARAAFGVTGGSSSAGTVGGASAAPAAAAPSPPTAGPPAWAQRMQRSQAVNHGATMAAHAVRSGDSHGGGSSVNLSESDRS